MKDYGNIWYLLCVIIFLLGCLLGALVAEYYADTHPVAQQSEQFGGYVPMKIYTIYDRDTGVYYAVTEKGGICVMETMSGETKLVDQGDGSVIHKDKGE